jgi:hypothetical protein
MKSVSSMFAFGLFALQAAVCAAPLVYDDPASTGPGRGKHVVLIASDHEYKSEEILPMLGRILAKHHGFRCTVLFGVDERTGEIKPGHSNIPGTEALAEADLLVLFTRFQDLPAAQMDPLVAYLDRGGPVIGLRTATHAFKIPADSPYAKFDFRSKVPDFVGGFGRAILGETWVGHHGHNHRSSTRLDVVPGKEGHPILRGVTGAWSELGGYNADPAADSEILLSAQPLLGMTPDAADDPAMPPKPAAWTRVYRGGSGREGRVFTTTYGGSGDLQNAGFRRLLVNACFWACGLDAAIRPDLKTDLVGSYRPTWLGTHRRNPQVKPEDLSGWDSPILPPPGTGPETEPTDAAEARRKAEAAAVASAQAAKLEADYQAWVRTLSPERQAWERVLQEQLGNFYLPLHQKDKIAGRSNAWDFVADVPGLPRVLLIGDSVSRGYTQAVRRELAGRANVHRAPANCGPTASGLKHLDVWLGDGRWDLIHFNFGIHDRNTPIPEYAGRLATLVERLREKAPRATLVWAATTPIPDLPDGKQTAASVVERNAAALDVMTQHGVIVNDLFSAVSPHLAEYQPPNDVHFTAAGYDFLGQRVAQAVSNVLAKPQAP